MAKKRKPFNALVIANEIQRRARLKMAIHQEQGVDGATFHKVHVVNSLDEGLAAIKLDPDFDVILVTDSFDLQRISDFSAKINSMREEKYGMVLVFRSSDKSSSTVANMLVAGIDGFLYEPFSVDSLLVISKLADKIRKENQERRLSSAARMVVGSLTEEVDKRAQQMKHGKKLPFSKQLHAVTSMFRDLPEEQRMEYYDSMLKAAEKRLPFQKDKVEEEYTGPSEILRKRYEREKETTGTDK